MRLVRLFQRVTAVMVWEAVHTCRAMALVYHVHEVSLNFQSGILLHHVDNIIYISECTEILGVVMK